MKTSKLLASAAVAGALFSAAPVSAQVSEDGMGKVVPVEIFACNFVEGKGRADLMPVIDEWNEYSDDNRTNNYAAWMLTPYFYTPEQAFDMLWLGAWTDGNAMGSGTNSWITEGGEVADKFAEVVDCMAHVAYMSAMYKAPPGNVPDSGVITMMDCELNEGSRYSDIRAAEMKWVEHLNDTGSDVGYYHWMPMFGGGDAEFDYKVVNAYESFVEVGADIEHFANGGGRDVSRGIFGDIDECDDARVYVASSIRKAKIRD
jgi:hypothetical protein